MLKIISKLLCILIVLTLLTQSSSASILRAQEPPANSVSINFIASGLDGAAVDNPTSLQFGPDGRLYVAQQDGLIYAFSIERNGRASYQVVASETIDQIKMGVPNHNDDGSENSTQKRQVTGILVSGSASQPVIYVTSSDWRIGAGSSGSDSGLDTNSGVLSRLTWDANGQLWNKVDLVRGLPRSEENHAVNGLALDSATNQLYLSSGGNTNGGAPSFKMAKLSEYALSAAILKVDLNALEAMPIQSSGNTEYIYNLPTVDDPTRANIGPNDADQGDPFGGNNGLNQARIVPNGPVQIYASGFRNAYDLLLTRSGRLYSIDNGGNAGWGGYPEDEGISGACTNAYNPSEPGSTSDYPNGDEAIKNRDALHYITASGYYAGHPNPIRGNPVGAGLFTEIGGDATFRTSTAGSDPLPADWPPLPVDLADPVQCDFRNPGVNDGALTYWEDSTNGMTEYTASNFEGALQGNILAAGYQGDIWRVILSGEGDEVLNDDETGKHSITLASAFGATPLDVTAQGDNDIFPGTIWVATYGADSIAIFEPADYEGGSSEACLGADDATLDEDSDGYANSDEIDNATDPCSAASIPPDNDGDFVSDLNDGDDDNDGLSDISDYFALDPANGMATNIPLAYSLRNNEPGSGFFGLGFTGLMSNGSDDYLDLYDPANLVAGGAAGLFTITDVTQGDALYDNNDQRDAFQFGINVDAGTLPFTVRANVVGPLFAPVDTPAGYQAQGLYIGTGDQDNFIRVALVANDGAGALQVLQESAGTVTNVEQIELPNLLAALEIDFSITVDPAAGTVEGMYAIAGGPRVKIGSTVRMDEPLRRAIADADKAVAIGLIASARNASSFNATWDRIDISFDSDASGEWREVVTTDGSAPTARHEVSYVALGDLFYLLGGRFQRSLDVFDPVALTWVDASPPPRQFHHFQAVAHDGLIYVLGAFEGTYPNETPVESIYLYDPSSDTWRVGSEIPATRRRGSGGTVVYGDKIYWAGGLQNGHVDGWVPWLDVFDPATDSWSILADAPRVRDHFNAVVIGDKLYAASGRKTGFEGSVFDATVAEVDVYEFASNSWSTFSDPLPTERAGAVTVGVGNQLIVIGGESKIPVLAHDETEALDVTTGEWRTLAPLIQGRHGMGAVVRDGTIYVAAGAGQRGSSPELSTQEKLVISQPTLPPTPTSTATATSTATSIATATNTATPTPSLTPTSTATATNTATNTATPTPTLTSTSTATATNTAANTATPAPTLVPTSTATATNTAAPTVTNTPTSTATATIAPTATATATIAPTATNTQIATPAFTPTFTPTFTPAVMPSQTPQPTATTELPTQTPTQAPTPTSTPTSTPTPSPIDTATAAPTPVPTFVLPTNTPAPNQPPIIEPRGSNVFSIPYGQRILVTIFASDPEGEVVLFEADALPPGATLIDFGEGTAQVIWTPTLDDFGTATFTVKVTDVQGESVTQEIMVIVFADHRLFVPMMVGP